MVATLFVSLFVLLLAAMPVYVALAGSVVMAFGFHSDIDLVIVIQRMFAGLNKFALMSIPFFILAANIMGEGGISRRIIKLANVIVGSITGGLGIASIISSMFFGAISGSAPATVVAIGGILFPALKGKGYDDKYSIGVLASSGALGIVIPPSITMIVYGAVTGSSVGELFIAGFGAGLIYGVVFIIYSYIVARKNPQIVVEKVPTFGEARAAFKEAAWGLGVPLIIIGGIYGGVFTPTEAAAVSVFYALFVTVFIYREVDLQKFYTILVRSGVQIAQVMILLSAASIFSWILTAEGVTSGIAATVLSISENKYFVLLLINVIILIAGMFIDGASIILILAPLFFPIATKLGVDPIHLGVIFSVNSAIGMFTPPFGLNLFVASSISGFSVTKVSRSVIPFILVSLITLTIVTYIPEVSLWLPEKVYGH